MNATKMRAKSHCTKAAFLTSLMSLILCFTMLVGTTLAWFTDTVTSGENQIIAGNLDIDVEYWSGSGTPTANGDYWKSIAGEKSLFSKGLWEPGHTEVVYLRVVNKGTLAFNYKLNVTPISETGGINQAGDSFKLSSYMCFAASTPEDSPVSYADRATARAVISETDITNAVKGESAMLKFMQEGVSAVNAKTLYAANDIPTNVENPLSTAYMALVVYMPEDVGNEANYKTGTTPPQITLGVTAYAWQEDYEKDSFGDDYDETADLTPGNEDAGIVEFDYFPQINVTGQLVISNGQVFAGEKSVATVTTGATTSKVELETTEKVDNETAAKLTTTVQKENETTATGSVTLKVVKDDSENAIFQADSTKIDTTKQDSTTYQVSVECEGVTAVAETEGKALYQVDLFIGKNRTNVKMYHTHDSTTSMMLTTGDVGYTASEAETFTYDASTGYVTMYVDEFSPFTATYDKPVCAIGTTAYYSLAAAIAAAESGNTITLIKDCATGDYYGITDEATKAGKSAANPIVLDDANVTLDLNGKTITVTHNFSFVIAGNNDIVKNGTIKAYEKRGDNQEYYRGYPLVVAATKKTGSVTGVQVEDVTIYGGISAGGSIENNYTDIQGAGNVTLTNCTIQSGYSYALYAQLNSTLNVVSGTYSAGKDGLAYAESGSTINIQGGTFTGKHVSSVAGTLSITGGTFSVDPSAYCASGYEATANGTTPETWTVAAILVAQVKETGVQYTSLSAAVTAAEAGQTVELLRNASVSSSVTLDKNLTIDGKDKTIDRVSGYTGNILTVAGNYTIDINNVTIDGGAVWSGDIDEVLGRGTTNTGVVSTGHMIDLSGNPTVTMTKVVLQNWYSEGGTWGVKGAWINGATLTMTDCIVRGFRTDTAALYLVQNTNSVLNLNGNGEYYGNYATPTGGGGGVIRALTATTVNINGGKFHNNYGRAGVFHFCSGYEHTPTLNIQNCEMYSNAGTEAGALGVCGTTTINEGTIIRDNKSDYSGAIRVYDFGKHPTLTINGGEITNNTGKNNTIYAYNTTLNINGGSIHDNNYTDSTGTTNISYNGGLGFKLGKNADVDDIVFSLSTNHQTVYLDKEFGTLEFTVNPTEYFANFNLQPDEGYTYTEGDENRLICQNDGYHIVWDSGDSTFRIAADTPV